MLQGLRVPEPLRKYIPGAPEFIPFTKELPKDSTSQKAKGAKADKGVKQKVAEAGEQLKNVVVG
jgi:seryl-tRNA synthetase